MKLQNVTLGADPEMFVFNTKTQKLVSAIPFIPGSKEEPYKPSDLPTGFGLQTDNVLVEFNIPPTALEDKASFINNLLIMRSYIDKYLHNKSKYLVTKTQASGYLPMSELTSEQSQMFGCDPDYNCYTETQNEKPKLKDINFRTAGFHVHIGYDNPNVRESVTLIKYLDLYLGVASIMVDDDRERRSLYGKAGCFRLQPWGVEYRSLSSYFMSNIDTISFVYNQTRKAIEAYENDIELPATSLVVNTINQNEIQTAKELIKQYNIL